MKDIMQKLAELEATAPKVTKKKMLKEDSTTAPINVSNKPASLKDVFAALSENVVSGQKPLPVLDPQNKQAGMGFVTSNNPAVQNMLKNLDPKDVQIMQAPGQPGQALQAGQPQATAAGQPNPNQMQAGQQAMQEEQSDSPVKPRYTVKPTKYSTSGKFMVRDLKDHSATGVYKTEEEAVAAAEKLNKEREHRLMRGRNDDRAPTNEGENDGYRSGASAYNDGLPMDHNPYADDDDMWDSPEAEAWDKGWKDAADGIVKEEAVEESGLQAYLGNKKYGKDGMNALRKAGRDHAGKEKMANIRAKYDKMDEGDLPSSRGVDTMGAGLGAGRSQTTLEGKKGVNPFAKKDEKAKTKAPAKGKKPDFLDLDKDGDKKEPMKKAAADKKKQKVKESMNHRISAARLEGKSHGLRGHSHSGKRYDDRDEMKAYHDGFKEGLDECYGQGVYETAMPAATVPGMASAAMHTMEDDMEEGNAFTAALAKTPKGGKFSVGGKTFTDRTGYDAKVNEYAFESLDQQLNALLNESEEVSEGLSVSISKGQQNSPDSVTITAQDAEAEHLLAFVKNAGLGLFGDDNADTHSSAMSVQPADSSPAAEIGVVDGHDGMMGLMQKLSGVEASGAEDYADEEGDEEQLYGNHETADEKDCGCDGDCECSDYDQPSNEESCNECGGMMEAGHSCGSKEMVDEVEDDEDHDEWHDKDGNVDPNGAHDAGGHYYRERDQVDEVESEDQMEFEVAEDNAPDSDEAETSADEDAEAKEDAALAGADSGDEEEMNESTEEEEETVSESFMNLFKKLAFIAEESTEKEDDKAEKAGKEVTKDIEHDDKEDKKGMSDKQAKFFGKKADKEKVDEWANNAGPGKTVSDTTFEQDIDFMTKVISGGLNKQKSTGQTTIPVITGQTDRMGATKEAVNESVSDWVKLAGIK